MHRIRLALGAEADRVRTGTFHAYCHDLRIFQGTHVDLPVDFEVLSETGWVYCRPIVTMGLPFDGSLKTQERPPARPTNFVGIGLAAKGDSVSEVVSGKRL